MPAATIQSFQPRITSCPQPRSTRINIYKSILPFSPPPNPASLRCQDEPDLSPGKSGSLQVPTGSESMIPSLKTSYERQFGERALSSRLRSRSAHPLLSARGPHPHFTCGGRGGGSRLSARRPVSDVPDTLPSCSQSRPTCRGACRAFAFSDPGLGGCRYSGTGVRVASFQKLGEVEGQRVWAGEACSWFLSFYFSFLQRRSKFRGACWSSPWADGLQVCGGARRWH